jgi:L-iditol 2-dehydrogenase
MATEMMRAAVLTGPRSVFIERIPRPAAEAADEVIAEVCYVGICRTDFQLTELAVDAARVLGHEVVCRIPGEQDFFAINNEISCGRCVYCQEHFTSHCSYLRELGVNEHGGYAEWIRVPRVQLHRFSFKNPVLGVLIEPLSCALHGEQRLRRFMESNITHPSVLIVGGGVSGALISYLLCRWPERPQIRLFDSATAELPWSTILQVQRVEEVYEESSQIVVECSGTPEGCRTAFQAIRRAGLICLYGVPEEATMIPRTARELFQHELTVLTSVAGATEITMQSAIELIQQDERFFEQLLGRRVPLEYLPAELIDWRPSPGTRTVVDLKRCAEQAGSERA